MTGARGLALIVALLVVALTAMLAVSLMRSESVWLKESTNLRVLVQAQAAIDGVLRLSAIALTADSRNQPTDALTGAWAQPLPPCSVAGGVVDAHLTDPTGRFNVNDLVVGGQPVPAAVAVFTRLLALAGLDPALAAAVVAWERPPGTAGGRLDTVYLARRHPSRAGRGPLAGVSELRLVLGFSPRRVQALRPYVTALPQVTPVNIDTAPGRVLVALAPGLTVQEGRILQSTAARAPFASPAAFIAALPAGVVPIMPIAVQTNYFMVHVTARFDDLTVRRRALLWRPAHGQPTTILWQEALWSHRHRSPTIPPPPSAGGGGPRAPDRG